MFKWILIMFQWIFNVILAFFDLFSAPLSLEVFLMKKESGKMFVSGRGEIAITLKVKKPSHVHVMETNMTSWNTKCTDISLIGLS